MSGDRAMAADAAAVALVSAAIAAAAGRLLFMSCFVPAVVAARFLVWAQLRAGERPLGLAKEALFFAACTLLGGFNDWSSVHLHGVYAYTVPVSRPDLSTIPAWMLLYWGVILRALATLASWRRLRPSPPRSDLHLPGRTIASSGGRLAVELLLVLATRQLVYRWAGDPLLSWLPFAAALALHAFLLRPDRHDRLLVLLLGTAGPLIEMLYIHAGGLHRYRLGWLGGVPLWIVLWWMLGVLVWKDASARLVAALAGKRASVPPAPSI